MKFNMVENSYMDWNVICEDFTDDFLHSELSNTEIREKYGLSHGDFKECCELVKSEYGLNRRPFWKHRQGSVKYYYKVNHGYMICKRYGNDNVYLGFVPSIQVAKMLVEMCKNVAWDIAQSREFCKNWREYAEV